MKKQVLLLACMIALPIFAQQDSVSFSLDAPENVVAGNEFEVTLTFNKGDLKDYSRFSQELPAGFTAENIISPNADFTFDEQRIRIIWLKLPDDQVIEVKYLISVNERLFGQLELDGIFAYVEEGERTYLELQQPISVEILPNPNIDQDLVVSIEEFPNVIRPANMKETEGQATDESSFATIVRQKPVITANGIVYVRLLVRTPENTNFLKLEESVPGGYSFEASETGGATVSQAASLARFVWMKPPSEEMFMISYRLVPILEKEQEPVLIEGSFTFNKDGKTQVEQPRQVDVNLSELSNSQKVELLETGDVSGEVASQRVTGSDLKDREAQQESVRKAEAVEKKPAATKPAVKSKRTAYQQSTGSSVVSIEPLEAKTGVYFRVQVAAVKNPYFARTYFADYDLLRDVKVEKSDRWNKYTVGTYSSYQEAEDMKKRIMRETPVKSAFVVAYRDGRRVPVNDVM